MDISCRITSAGGSSLINRNLHESLVVLEAKKVRLSGRDEVKIRDPRCYLRSAMRGRRPGQHHTVVWHGLIKMHEMPSIPG